MRKNQTLAWQGQGVLLFAAVFIGLVGCDKKPETATTPNQPNAAQPALSEFKGKIKVGHLVGICMSPLFVADAKGYFKDEGLDVKLEWMKSPSDATTALSGGAAQFIHNPFTNTYQADANGANLKIIAGSGNGGLVCIAQPGLGLTKLDDLKSKAGKGLKVGSQRVNTLEMSFYRMLVIEGLSYKDFDMHYFPDHFSMLAAFQNKEVDVVTHVEPYATMLIDQYGGIPIGNSFEVWGEGSPDCVISVEGEFLAKYPGTVEKYLRAVLRADAWIKANREDAVNLLDEKKYYKVDKATIASALPRQMPGVDLRQGVKGMDIAINDMVSLGYIKKKPENVVDLTILEKVLKE
jgi:NitT/TauT family transport system substrate-binding protein